jgi:hypothetical protein
VYDRWCGNHYYDASVDCSWCQDAVIDIRLEIWLI